MTNVEYVKAFTENPVHGNPAGVVILEGQLDESVMSDIAKKVGFSATAFLTPLDDGSIQIRFFSPRAESALCVHGLLGSAERLSAHRGWTKPTLFHAIRNDFLVDRMPDGSFMVDLPRPIFGKRIDELRGVAEILGISPEDIDDLPVEVVGTGKLKILIPIRSLDTLLGMMPNEEAAIEYCKKVGAEGVFPFCRETKDPAAAFHARHWNPMALESEDPICGNASGALAAYLEKHGISPGVRFVVEMGVSTRLPGEVIVDCYNGIRVGGFAVKFDSREF